MTDLRNMLKAEWCRVPEYTDVEVIAWTPDLPRETKCPQGCDLEVHEPSGWGKIDGYDARRHTRLCRAHGYTRIYFITGPDAMAHNWTPQKDKPTG